MDNDDIQILVAILAVVIFAIVAIGWAIRDNRDSKIIIDRRESDGWEG